LAYLFDCIEGVFANRSGGNRLKPTESGEFANTVCADSDVGIGAAAANIVANTQAAE
jgi:hypothetical protein